MNSSRNEDAFEILQVLNRYALAIDEHDWHALESVFAEDAVADYTSIAAGLPLEGRPAGRTTVIQWLSTALADRRGTFHFMTNHVIDVDGDRAKSRHYMHNRNLSICGVYVCEHIRTADGWRIRSLQLNERVLDEVGVDEARDLATQPLGVVTRVRKLTDQSDLKELLPRYARIIDEQRWSDIASVFTEKAVADYTSIGGYDATLHGPDAIAAWLEKSLGARTESVPWHYVTDTIVTSLKDDSATCESYMHNRYMKVIGVYRIEAVRTADGWRIVQLTLDAQLKPGTPEQ